jgi:uncharacterized membrane protein YeaQ/YmgE (transglycosylase-associated protein family)
MTVLFWLLALIVLFAIVGWGIIGYAWLVLWYALVGIIIGGLARLLVRGTSNYGIGMTILAGIGGSLLGGLLAHWIGVGGVLEFILAVLVAAVLVALTAPAATRMQQ